MIFPCRRAKLLLKKKRYREQLLDRTENQISSLEAMVGSGQSLCQEPGCLWNGVRGWATPGWEMGTRSVWRGLNAHLPMLG